MHLFPCTPTLNHISPSLSRSPGWPWWLTSHCWWDNWHCCCCSPWVSLHPILLLLVCKDTIEKTSIYPFTLTWDSCKCLLQHPGHNLWSYAGEQMLASGRSHDLCAVSVYYNITGYTVYWLVDIYLYILCLA